MFLFHGTSGQNLEAIAALGLDPRVGRRANFGNGVYAAEDPRLSDMFVGR